MKRIDEVLGLLADGQFHSGEDIGSQLGISRSAIWKITKQLDELGIEVHRVQGRGYCIPGGIQLFSLEKIQQFLPASCQDRVKKIEVFDKINSTNAYLHDRIKEGWPSGSLCLAEYQSDGRGRRGRAWLSSYGKNIYMSLLWKFSAGPAALTGLTLLVGLAIIKALTKLNISGLSLKWPNDVMWHGSKLAGVLTEISVDDVNGCHAVIGLGLNLCLSSKIRSQVQQRITDVQTILGHYPDKNYLTAMLIEELFLLIPEFEQHGFEHYVEQWQSYDHLRNRQVTLKTANDKIVGIAQGIDLTGALHIRVNGTVEKYYSGEASIEEIV